MKTWSLCSIEGSSDSHNYDECNSGFYGMGSISNCLTKPQKGYYLDISEIF